MYRLPSLFANFLFANSFIHNDNDGQKDNFSGKEWTPNSKFEFQKNGTCLP